MSNLNNLLEEIMSPLTEGSVIKDRLAAERLSKLRYQIVKAVKERGYQVLHHMVETPKDDDWQIERVETMISFKGKDGDLDGLIEDSRQLVKEIVKGKGEKKVRSRPDPQAKVVDYDYSRPKGLHLNVHYNTHVGTGSVFVAINEVISTESY